MPMVPVRAELRALAKKFGVNERAAAASSTLSRVLAATWARPFRAFDAVATETPATRATSARVTVVDPALSPVVAMYRN